MIRSFNPWSARLRRFRSDEFHRVRLAAVLGFVQAERLFFDGGAEQVELLHQHEEGTNGAARPRDDDEGTERTADEGGPRFRDGATGGDGDETRENTVAHGDQVPAEPEDEGAENDERGGVA